MRRSEESFKKSHLTYIFACALAGVACAIAKASGKREALAERERAAEEKAEAKIYKDLDFDVYEGTFEDQD